MASPVSLESSRKKKRPRRSLSREPSSTPAGARRSSGEAWGTPSSAASEDGRSVNGSAKSSRAKRRRSSSEKGPEFPMSFPRLDNGSVAPSCGGQIESGVSASRHANEKHAGYLEEGRGSRNGNDGDSLGSFSLTVRDAVASEVRASVSARQLDELFFGAAKRLSRSTDGEGVSTLAEPGDVRSSGSSPRTGSSVRDAGVLEDCDLFDDLVPLGMPSKDHSPERLGCKLSSESVRLETRKTDDPFSEKLAAGDSASHSKPEAEATAKERAIEHSSLPQASEDVRRTEKSSFDESGSGKHNTSLGSRCARGETRSEDFESKAPVEEDVRGSAVKTPVGKRGHEHGEIVSGIGSGAGGGDTASSCSVPETPSPQVYALDTPPKSPPRNPAGNDTSLSNTNPPGETETMPSSAPASAGVAPTGAYFAVPETQPSPVANRGRKPGRTVRLKDSLSLPCDAVPESKPQAWSTSRLEAFPSVSCDAAPGRQPTTRMATVKGRTPRGKRRNVAAVAAAASAAANDILDSGSSSFGRRSSARLSARKVSADASTVNDRGAPAAEESTSATVDTVSETYAEIRKSLVSLPGEKRAARGSPNLGPDKSAPPGWDQNGGLPTPAPAQASVSAGASSSLAGESCHQHAADGGSGAVDGGTCREPSIHKPVESTSGDILSSPSTADAARSGSVTGRRGRGSREGGTASTEATRPSKQLPQDSGSSAPQSSTSTSVADTRGCDRRNEGEDASEASPDGPGMDAGAGPPEAARACGGSGWAEDGCEGVETPARPRRLAEKFEEGFGNTGAVERAADDGALAQDEDSQQTPASAPGFDYSPVGCSQTLDDDETKKDGLTVAEMLSTKRSLCSDLPAPPAPSLETADTVSSAAMADCSDKTLSGVVPPNQVAPPTDVPTLSDVAPSDEVMNPKDGVPQVKGILLKEAPPSNQAPKRPVAARRVPNPYATGAGSLLTPGRIKADRKSLPASPFAAAVEAAARKRAATEVSSAAVRAQSRNDEHEAVRKGCEAKQKGSSVGNEGCEVQPPGVTPSADSKLSGNKVPRDEGIGGGRKREDGLPAPSGPTGGGFQTARGRPLEVSAAAMAKVQHLFDESHAVKPNSVDDAGSSPSTRREADVGVQAPQRPGAEEVRRTPFIGNDPRRREAGGTMGASGAFVGGGGTDFQTGRGRALCVSAAALAKVDHLFRDDGEPASHRDKFPARPPSTPAVARDSGRNPRAFGPARSPEVTHPFRARGVNRSFIGPRSFKHPAPLSKADAVQSGGGGSGVPRTKGAAAARVHSESVYKGGGVPVVPEATLAGAAAFHTAKGRKLHVSDEAIARVSHIFAGKEDRAQSPAGAVTAAPWLSVHGHHKEETAIIAARAKATTNGSEAGVTRESCARVVVGFSPSASDSKINASWIRGGVGGGGHRIPDGPTKDCVKGSNFEDFQFPSGLDSGTADADSRFADFASASPTAEDHASALPVDTKATSCRLIKKEADARRAGMADGGTAKFNSDPEMSTNAIAPTTTMANAPHLRQVGGFSTARGRPLTVSAEALAKISHLFDGGPKAETRDAAVIGSEGRKNSPGRLKDPMTKNQSLCASSSGKSGLLSARRGSEVDSNRSKKKKGKEGVCASLERRAEGMPTIGTVGVSNSTTPSNDLTGGEYSTAVGSATGEASAGMIDGKEGLTTGFRNLQGRSLCVSVKALNNLRRLSSEGNCVEEIPSWRRDSSATVGGGGRGARVVDGTLGQGAVASTTGAMSGGLSSSSQGGGAYQAPSPRSAITRKDIPLATSGGVTPSGFVTGRGAPVHVSADALSKARQFLARGRSADEAVENDTRDGESAADPSYPPPTVKGVTGKSCSFSGVRERDSCGGGGRSGRGVDYTLALGAVASAPGVMSGGASSSRQDRGAYQASRSRDIGKWKNTTLAPSGGVTPSGFVTGRGAPVHVSADALSKAREFLGRGRSADEAVENDAQDGESAADPSYPPPAGKGVTGMSCSFSGVRERDSGGGGGRSGRGVDCTLALGAVASTPGLISGGAPSSCQDRDAYQASRPRDIGTWKNTTLAPSGGVAPSGFVTGRGAPVHVSADALSKAREFLGRGRSADEAVENDAQDGESAAVPSHLPPAVKYIKSESRSSASVPERDSGGGSSGGTDGTIKGNTAGTTLGNPPPSSMIFSTGKGRPINVSVEALARAQRLFEDADLETSRNTKQLHRSTVIARVTDSHEGTIGHSGGVFSTAKGTAIKVSTEALTRAKKMFEEPGSVAATNPRSKDGEASEGHRKERGSAGTSGSTRTGTSAAIFSTGTGRTVEVSADAMAMTEKMFRGVKVVAEAGIDGRVGDDGDGSGSGGASCAIRGSTGLTTGQNPPPPSMMFISGKGRPIEVSPEALARAHRMFKDVDPQASPTSKRLPSVLAGGVTDGGDGDKEGETAHMSSTGDDTAAEVSAETMTQAKKMFGEPESKRGMGPQNGIGGGDSDGGRRQGRSVGSSSITRTDTSASMFSTGTGRAVVVSAEAMARAEKIFLSVDSDAEIAAGAGCEDGKDKTAEMFVGALSRGRKTPTAENQSHSREEPTCMSARCTSYAYGGIHAVAAPVAAGAAANAVDTAGSVLITHAEAPIGVPYGAKRAFSSLSTSFRQPRVGKENDEGRDGLRAGAVSRTTPTRPMGGIVHAASSLGGGSISGVSRQRRGLAARVNGTLGGKSAGSPFSPLIWGGRMPPPSGASTPSSRRKPLARRVAPTGAFAASPIGSSSTPKSFKKSSVGSGVVSGSRGSSGILKRTKRPRAMLSTVRTSPRALPQSDRGGSHKTFPRPDAVELDDGSVTIQADQTESQEGCSATRKLFGSPGKAQVNGAKKKRISGRRWLSSLLNSPPRAAEVGAASSDAESFPRAIDNAARAALTEEENATEEAHVADRENAATRKTEATKGETDWTGEKVQGTETGNTTAENRETTAAKTGSIVEKGKDAGKEAVSQDARVFLPTPEAFARAVGGGPQSAPESRTRSVVAVLHEVTPTTAPRVRFHHEDGRPCCIETRDASRGSAARGEAQGVVNGTKKAVAGMLGATSCSRDSCCSMQDSSVALFREELGKGGKDGSLASRAWVENHLRWIVWKLAATERRFPRHFPGGYLTADRVSRQLRYRYDVELERAKKPALRAILQGDASAARPLVLCVSRVYTPEELGDRLGTAAAVIEVTDGWYPVEASLDEVLAHFLRRGKIVPGTKLAVSNAALDPGVNVPSPDDGRGSGSGGSGVTGVDPLDLLRRRDAGELPPGAAPRLRLTVNSTRRARWDSRLGFFPPRLATHSSAGPGLELSALEVPLCTVVAGGGIVTATRVVILRRYPTLYISEDVEGVHHGPEGSSTGEGGRGRRRILSEVEEEGERELHQARMQRIMDTEASGIEEEVMTEMEEATPEPFRRMKEADNPSSYLETLSPEEKKDALDWRDRHQQVMEGLKQKALDERLRNLDVPDRKVRQLITAIVMCTCYHAGPGPSTVTVHGGFPPGSGGGGGGGGCSGGATWCRRPTGRRHLLPPMMAMLKVWAPSETTAGLLTEGVEIRLHGVNATNCRSHTSGCSLELSAGRQTKIELLSSPAATDSTSSRDSAAASLLPEGETTTHGARFMPRRCTPLYLLRPSSSLSSCGVGNTNHYGSTGGGVGEARGLGFASQEAVEVDFVGCVFAVTRELPSSETPGEEVLVTASCSSPLAGSADSVTSRGDRPEAGRDNKSGRASESGGVPENDARRCGQVGVAGDRAAEKLVTYRVYFTEPSGACACLEKKIRPELSRHHRILRAPSGSCWAVLSGESRTCSSSFHGGETRLDVAGRGLSAGGGETFAKSRHAFHPRGMEVIRWLPTTAAGGSGGSPPRSLAGAPASHLAQPLLALRRWARDAEGKNAVRRERQRLHLLLAREKRVRTAVAQRGDEGSGYGGDGDADGQRVIDCNPNELVRPAPARAREVLQRTRSVTGFVSSFDPRVSALDDGFIGIRVDDGESVRVLLLSRLVLTQLFRGSLDGNGNGCRRDLTVRGAHVSMIIDGESAGSGGVAGGQTPVMLKLSSAGELLVRAQALLRLFRDQGLSPGAENVSGVMPSPPESGAPKTADDAHTSERQREASTSRLGGDDGTAEPPNQSSRSKFGPPQDVVSGRDVDISSFSPDQLIGGLTGAVFQMMHKWREISYRCNALGDAHLAEPQISSVSAPPEGAQNIAPREDHRISTGSASDSPSFGSRCVAGERTPVEAFLGDAIALLGLRQRTFVIAEAAQLTRTGLGMVAQNCGEVDAVRSAAELLEDLVAADPPA